MALLARALVRKMRGGAQAHLVEASDGHFYVVKFKNNPQHRRILINEWIAGVLLDYLQILTPARAFIQFDENFLQRFPEAGIQLGKQQQPPEPGRHFGSRYPGHPERLAVYDFLPDVLLMRVANVDHFLGILVFDKWVANADSRQAIFFRARLRDWINDVDPPEQISLVAQMIDHGYAFGGPQWRFQDSPLAGLYPRFVVYESVRGWADFEPWLERIRCFPEWVLDEAYRQIPGEWLEEGEEEELEHLLEQLLQRRRRVADLIEECRRGPRHLFPHWSR